ncbi:hypothetical protein CDL12_09763 [Handroanthus impetiginosus]|uniref:Uncharacterized protein n=1 Tax=Handroanthus impetiginosus TaxID=429701 RepID=A0A2G9HJ72_9LAMI|nr:hypothetical protein CDL12_09763 [Handroanthus impetiginosus]
MKIKVQLGLASAHKIPIGSFVVGQCGPTSPPPLLREHSMSQAETHRVSSVKWSSVTAAIEESRTRKWLEVEISFTEYSLMSLTSLSLMDLPTARNSRGLL